MENNNLISVSVENTVTISTEEYARLTKRSFALDIIIANSNDASYILTGTINHIRAALGEADGNVSAADA